jgi:hypothetical protein
MTPHATRSLPLFDQPVSFMQVTPALKPGVQTRTPRKRARRRLLSRLPSARDRPSPVVAVLPYQSWALACLGFTLLLVQPNPSSGETLNLITELHATTRRPTACGRFPVKLPGEWERPRCQVDVRRPWKDTRLLPTECRSEWQVPQNRTFFCTSCSDR